MVEFVVECAACRWQTNKFEQTDKQPSHDRVPLTVLLYFARHVESKHREYRNNTVTGIYEKLGHKVRAEEGCQEE